MKGNIRTLRDSFAGSPFTGFYTVQRTSSTGKLASIVRAEWEGSVCSLLIKILLSPPRSGTIITSLMNNTSLITVTSSSSSSSSVKIIAIAMVAVIKILRRYLNWYLNKHLRVFSSDEREMSHAYREDKQNGSPSPDEEFVGRVFLSTKTF